MFALPGCQQISVNTFCVILLGWQTFSGILRLWGILGFSADPQKTPSGSSNRPYSGVRVQIWGVLGSRQSSRGVKSCPQESREGGSKKSLHGSLRRVPADPPKRGKNKSLGDSASRKKSPFFRTRRHRGQSRKIRFTKFSGSGLKKI